MQHYIYTKRVFGEVVEQIICLHFKPEEVERLVSLVNIGATVPGEPELEDRRMIDGIATALADAENDKGFSNTEIHDF